MKNAKLRICISLICVVATLALAICGVMLATKSTASLSLDKGGVQLASGEDKEESAKPAATRTFAMGLPNDSTYVYTDVTLNLSSNVVGIASKNGANETDKRVITVVNPSDSANGSEANPYAIYSTADWTSFLSDVASSPYGKGKFYVLANDIDFGATAITSVPRFAGNFCGNLNRIDCVIAGTNCDAAGFIKLGEDGMSVRDLTLKYSAPSLSCAWNFGGIVGITGYDNAAGVQIYNCNVQGSVNSTITTAYASAKIKQNGTTCFLAYGGLIGSVSGASKYVDIYKCAVKFDVTVSVNRGSTSDNHQMISGLIGCDDPRGLSKGKPTVRIRDVYCAHTSDVTSAGSGNYHSCATAAFQGGTGGNTIYITNIVSSYRVNINVTFSSGNSANAVCITSGNSSVLPVHTNGFFLYNVYDKGSSWAIPFTGSGGTSNTATNRAFSSTGYGNYMTNVVKATGASDLTDTKFAAASEFDADLWNKPNVKRLTDPANTPDIVEKANHIFKDESVVTLCNLNGSSDEAIVSTDFYTTWTTQTNNVAKYQFSDDGANLPTLNDGANKKFLGWTKDKTWSSTPLTKFSASSMAGAVTLHAVWEMIDVNPTVSPDKTSAQTYSGSDLFTITAYPNTPATATNTVTWYKQGGTATTSVGSGLTHSIKDVDESGEYYVTVEAVDSVYPLWKTATTKQSATTTTLTINKHQLQYKANSFGLNTGVICYEGQALNEVTASQFSAICLENDSATPFTAGVYSLTASGTSTFAEGDNNVNLVFTPSDASNYAGWTEPVKIPAVKYEIEFKLYNDAGLDLGETIKLDNTHDARIAYKGSIAGDDLIALFKQEYDKKVAAAILANDGSIYTQQKSTIPYVGLTSPIKWDAYPNTAISLNPPPPSFDIKLQLQTYTFTFKYDNGTTSDRVDTINLNVAASKPIAEPTKTGWVFDDWYRVNGGIMESTPWDFNTLITEDVTVQAKWVTINYVLHEVVVTVAGELTADTALTGSELQVKAIFYEDDDTAKKKKETMLVKDTDYTISYPINNELHIVPTGDTQFTITYAKGGVTKVVNVDDATIVQQEIDMTKYVEFTQTTFPWDGNAHAIKVQLKSGVSKYPTQVDETATVYTYSQGTSIIPEADLKDAGTYSVKAEFAVKGSYATDYKIKAPIIVSMTILDKAIELEVTWDGTDFPYDHGKIICPKPTFTRVDNSSPITLTDGTDFDITGDIAVTDVNNNYKITLTLTGTAATTYSIKDGKTATSIEKTFNITICELDTPYIADGTKIEYNGAPQEVKDSLTGYDATIMSVTNGGTQTNAKKNYKAYITLTDTTNYKWKDSATASVTVDWAISKRMLDVIWDETEFIKKGNTTYSPKVDDLFAVCMIDRGQIDFTGQTDFTFDGDRDKSVEGSYSITVAFSEKAENGWAANYELNPASATVAWVVIPKAGMEVINIQWNLPNGGEYTYNKEIQGPKIEDATFTFSDGTEITGAKLAEIKAALKFGGDATTSKYAGDYEATVSLGTNSKYYIKEGATVQYTIVKDGDEGAPPEGPITDDPNDSNSHIGSGVNIAWQYIVMAISGVLIILFAVLTANFNNKRKQADADTAKYNKVAVGAGTAMAVSQFSFSPEDKMAGMPIGVWSVLAIGMAVIAAAMLVVMLMAQNKCNKAVAARNEAFDAAEMRKEQLAIAKEEKAEQQRLEREAREREERRQQTESMQMMMASMMSAINTPRAAGSGGEDTRQIVAEVIQQLMPAMTQYLPAAGSAGGYMEMSLEAPQYSFAVNDDTDEITDEEWDLDEDDEDDDVELEPSDDPTPLEALPAKLSSNFRMRLKETSDKNRETYCLLKNAFNAQKGVASRVCGRVEKFKYHGDIIAVMGIAKRSIKLWLALDPSDYDQARYFHKDVSDKERYREVPMYVLVGSDRARTRTLELLSALFAKFGIEPRRRYEDRTLQELIYTLKGNKLLKDAAHKDLLRESIHVDDAGVLANYEAELCLETKISDPVSNPAFETVDLDTLDDNFVDGQKITLDLLKKRGLVSDSANGFSVTAGNRLSKPFIIVANEFSIDAVKMIVMTGGRAIQLV